MKTYNIDCYSQQEKYNIMDFLRSIGAKITDVSGYYEGFIIHFRATLEMAKMVEQAIVDGAI